FRSGAETLGATVPLSPVALAEVLGKAVKTEGGSAEIQVDAPSGLNVLGEGALLYRCFSNIIRNSVRYAGQAGPITIREAVSNGDVRITFADSGPGVPQDALEKLFTPFYRTEESRSRSTGGAGWRRFCGCGGPEGFANRVRLFRECSLALESYAVGEAVGEEPDAIFLA